eukprot:6214683-Pleurochrysis_carterae.AAC.2
MQTNRTQRLKALCNPRRETKLGQAVSSKLPAGLNLGMSMQHAAISSARSRLRSSSPPRAKQHEATAADATHMIATLRQLSRSRWPCALLKPAVGQP